MGNVTKGNNFVLERPVNSASGISHIELWNGRKLKVSYKASVFVNPPVGSAYELEKLYLYGHQVDQVWEVEYKTMDVKSATSLVYSSLFALFAATSLLF